MSLLVSEMAFGYVAMGSDECCEQKLLRKVSSKEVREGRSRQLMLECRQEVQPLRELKMNGRIYRGCNGSEGRAPNTTRAQEEKARVLYYNDIVMTIVLIFTASQKYVK